MLPDARRFWRRVVPELAAAGLLHPVDVPALVMLASTYALWERTMRELLGADLERAGELSRTASELGALFLEQARDFGLTPRSRREFSGASELNASAEFARLRARRERGAG